MAISHEVLTREFIPQRIAEGPEPTTEKAEAGVLSISKKLELFCKDFRRVIPGENTEAEQQKANTRHGYIVIGSTLLPREYGGIIKE